MAVNCVVLTGRLTRDPELKFTPAGVAVASFTVAVDRNVARDAQGQRETDFIPCVAWRQTAEFAGQYLTKGRLVAVQGRLQVRKYQTSDGQNRTFTEVACDRLDGLDRPKVEDADPDGAGEEGQ